MESNLLDGILMQIECMNYTPQYLVVGRKDWYVISQRLKNQHMVDRLRRRYKSHGK